MRYLDKIMSAFKQTSRGIILMLIIVISSCQQPVDAVLPDQWPEVKSETKPWTRWWWLGNAVDSANLKYNLKQLADAGIGGVEITPLYGVKGYENQFIDHLSPHWMDMLDYTVSEAHAIGMKVDMVQGTGWPFGGPHVQPQHAASKLILQTYALKKGKALTKRIIVEEKKQEGLAQLESVLAFVQGRYIQDLTTLVDSSGHLNWKYQDADVQIYAVFCGKTRQQVKRSAPGGAGYTLDHFSAEALEAYCKPYEETIAKNKTKLRALFNDSYEVYGTTWTPGFLDKFKTLRGYDLRPYIPLLVQHSDTDTLERVLGDYRETISDLLLNSFLKPWTAWANKNNYLTKNQSHGSPGNLLDLYGAADIPECETFGSTAFKISGLRRDSLDIRSADPDPVMLKFASSAANVNGKKLTSSESCTWLREHFRGALSHCKPEIEQLFLSGINHVFFHGTTYSPKEDQWPGWKFYASMNFHPNNPIWHDAPAFFDYITRCQSILQSSVPENDLLVYWPVYDVWDNTEHSNLFMQLNIHEIAEWLYPTDFYKVSTSLASNGYSYDFISDKGLNLLSNNDAAVQAVGSNQYKAIVLPKCDRIPNATFSQLLSLAENGATLVMQDLPSDVPGLGNLEERRILLNKDISKIKDEIVKQNSSSLTWGKGKLIIGDEVANSLLENEITGEKIASHGLDYLKKKFNGGHYYYIVNHSAQAIEEDISFAETAKSVVLMDPESGKTGSVPFTPTDGSTSVFIQLKSGESVFVKLLDNSFKGTEWTYYKTRGKSLPVSGPWAIQFIEGGPSFPADTSVTQLESWTMFGADAESFAGTAVYSTTIEMPDTLALEYTLNLGDVRESVRIRINEDSVGVVWSNPYSIKVGAYLKPGLNHLELEVTNLGANRIRDLDKRGVNWKKFYNTNIVTVAYKPFDASVWDLVPSGLIGPVELIPMTRIK